MLSPVWTPTGSKFSMEQTVMTLPVAVANDLELDFLPARNALFNEDLV